jgi:hypothetical protein
MSGGSFLSPTNKRPPDWSVESDCTARRTHAASSRGLPLPVPADRRGRHTTDLYAQLPTRRANPPGPAAPPGLPQRHDCGRRPGQPPRRTSSADPVVGPRGRPRIRILPGQPQHEPLCPKQSGSCWSSRTPDTPRSAGKSRRRSHGVLRRVEPVLEDCTDPIRRPRLPVPVTAPIGVPRTRSKAFREARIPAVAAAVGPLSLP